MQSRRKRGRSSCTYRSSARLNTAMHSSTGSPPSTSASRVSSRRRRRAISPRDRDGKPHRARKLGESSCPSEKESALAGKPVHLEIPAADTSRAQDFYKNLFGWEFRSMEGPVEYH